MWNEENGWVSLAWFTGGRTPAGIAAALLQVGTGGRYAFAETWGPRYPDTWAHDWTQEGRCVTDRHPDVPYAEDSARLTAARQAKEQHLVAALAERSQGTLTVDQVTERLRAGGQEYRDFLHIGAVCIMDDLHHARRAAEGAERLRLREALDALEHGHEVADWVVDLTHAHLATDPDAHFEDGARSFRRRALQEFLTPSTSTDGIPGLTAA
ncbi:hypothetical protein [Streptomyces sp. NPDC008240]|uniref:hypothetical protein n=1 Tax=Streptomyces sp. NPDC008240 TaxID=3364822 RepID=UPI0036EB663F